jgi:hypothetical protein
MSSPCQPSRDSHMDPVGKRQSAKKNSERSVYTQKAVRAKEALQLKKKTANDALGRNSFQVSSD